MELKKSHRESLMAELEKANEDLKLQSICLTNVVKNEDQKHLIEWFEIALFLAQKRAELIKQRLIDNEIDF